MWDGWNDDYALKRILIILMVVVIEAHADTWVSAKFENSNFSVR